ncbi:TetR/AcrR family transcriptional regulator [Parasphingopyxis marina]|uniref:TetR family transcriptional regulator n=1 Tax=Parasphingopyxis marina TaxID=2761622 RepID=A0A842I150_9SPHN|nr:TetR family transcriptional regulator [Parasphingopyxis marina]MBC2777494.1 TetR family transcriptional regulator [Parasphingopyxis marina]
MADSDGGGRARQRLRTRKDLLRAATRLMQQGTVPSLEEAAEEAMVSRATAYRYFSSAEDLQREAALEIALPDAATIFADPPADPAKRVDLVDAAFDHMTAANEVQLRIMLARALERRATGEADKPVRQNRRQPLIEEALAPIADEIGPAALDRLAKALSYIIATEGFIVGRDVLRIDDTEARAIRRWAIRALIDAARKDGA